MSRQVEQQEQGLKRQLGLGSVTSIVVANMIGAGIFTTSGLLVEGLGSVTWMLALWAVGGVIALCGALCYGELGAAIPRAGGEYAFLARLYHPSLGFLSGWVSFFAGFSAPIAASAIGFSEYIVRAFPAVAPLVPGGEPVFKKVAAIAVIALFTLIHRRGLHLGTAVQNLLTTLKVGLVVALIVVGFAFGRGDFAHLSLGGSLAPGLAGWKTAGLALMWILFAYSGWNAAAYIGSEIRQPERTMPRSLILGTLGVTVLYLALNLLFVYAVPPADMAGVVSIGGLTVDRLFGQAPAAAVSLLIAFALFSSLSAFIILGPRVYYAMARDGLFFKAAGRIHPRFNVPSVAIVLQGLVASLIVLIGSFDQILTYMGFSLGLFPLLAVAGVFRLRRLGILPYRMPGFPLAPVLYLVSSSAILMLAFLERPMESSVALLMVAAGIPFYLVFAHRQRQPANNVKTNSHSGP